ncbi:MAG TPA: ParB/RepB/Spo0J family partition protein [Synergistales bacterium]|nr:ParB/RepB/Spo0J family partition protein [Synergistales bacterium]
MLGKNRLFKSNSASEEKWHSSPIHVQGSSLLEIPLQEIRPNPFQPRQNFDPDELDELTASIKEMGIIQPILVKAVDGGYEIVVGERRFRAARLAGLRTIPAMVSDVDPSDQHILALMENIHRSDLSSVEEAFSLRDILDRTGWSQTELAQKLGRSQAALANKLRLLKLEPRVRDMVIQRKIGERQARSLVGLAPEDQFNLASRAVEEELPAKVLEKLARRTLKNEPSALASSQAMKRKSRPGGPLLYGPDGPTGELLDGLTKLVQKGRNRGIPVSMKIRELAKTELMVEIKVEIQKDGE